MTQQIDTPIVLVGLMGAGKTTLGRLLAEANAIEFIDTDELIVSRAGADIPWIFDVEGESGFRERETAVLEELMNTKQPTVISTGGGIVTQARNRELLKDASHVIYLSVTPQKLYARIGKDKRRPLLNTPNPQQTLIDLFEARDPLYNEVATQVVETSRCSPKEALVRLKAAVSR